MLKFCTCHIQTIYVPASLMWPSNCVHKFIITVSNVESLLKIPQCFTSKIKCYERKIQFKSESGSKFGENRFESIDGGSTPMFSFVCDEPHAAKYFKLFYSNTFC